MSETFEQFQREIAACAPTEGVTSLALMSLPGSVRRVLNKLIRNGPQTAAALAAEFGVSGDEMRQLAEAMQAKGFLEVSAQDGAPLYRPRLARTRELSAPPPPPPAESPNH